MVLLARKDEEGNTQALYDHLHGAGRLASGFDWAVQPHGPERFHHSKTLLPLTSTYDVPD